MNDIRQELQKQIFAPWRPQLIYAAVRLGIPDLLRAGSLSADDLARAAGAHPSSLRRALRAMAVVGIVSQDADGRFRLAPMGELLLSDNPEPFLSEAIVSGEVFQAWSAMLHTLRTGETAFDHVFGEGLFRYFASRPELEAHFNRHMAAMTEAIAQAVVQAYDFSDFATVVDIGGGYGGLLVKFLSAHQEMRGLLFDLLEVVESAREHIAGLPCSGRLQLVAGDFLQAVPPGGDVYLMQVVLHDWDDRRAAQILRNCRVVIPPHGKLLIIERLLPDRPSDEPATVQLDLNMLVLTGGRERSLGDFEHLLNNTGFRLARVIPTEGDWKILEGIPR